MSRGEVEWLLLSVQHSVHLIVEIQSAIVGDVVSLGLVEAVAVAVGAGHVVDVGQGCVGVVLRGGFPENHRPLLLQLLL